MKAVEHWLQQALGSESDAQALLSGAAWRRLCDALVAADRLVTGPDVPGDARHRAEGYRYLSRFLAAGLRSCVTHDDPDYPVLQRMIDYSTPWGLDHPDCLYLYAPLRGGASYTLFGNRGSANVLDIQVNSGHFSAGRVDAVQTLAVVAGDDLNADAEGNFKLTIGPDAPELGGVQVGPEARFLHIRQYFADWDNERPADLLIERDDAIWPMPAPKPALVGRQLDTLVQWLERAGAQWEGMSKGMLSMPANSLLSQRVDTAGAHGAASGQVYGMGNFHCDLDEAVVVQVTIPPCKHWNIALFNWYWECVEYASRQSSLNQHQARPSGDGAFHFVIAHQDPGVANWLDPGENLRGSLSLRLYDAAEKPQFTAERMPLDRVAAALPRDIATLAPEMRAGILRQRRHSVLRRFRT